MKPPNTRDPWAVAVFMVVGAAVIGIIAFVLLIVGGQMISDYREQHTPQVVLTCSPERVCQ